MMPNDIIVGETYLFVGSDSPKRQHLAGSEFTVVRKDFVYRRFKGNAHSARVLRFFDDDGNGARPDELEPIAKDKPIVCYICGQPTVVQAKCERCGELICLHHVAKYTSADEEAEFRCTHCNLAMNSF